MKISAATAAAFVLASTRSASAFAPSTHNRGTASKSTTLSMSDPLRDNTNGSQRAGILDSEPEGFAPNNAPMIDSTTPEPPKIKQRQQSQAIPFMTVSPSLDGSMAGDVGFDPLGFADSDENLNNYREAEIKHARLAMLAAAGWPLSELWDRKIAEIFGMEPVLDATNRAPSVLNGGLGKISPGYWAGCIVLAGAIDVYGAFFASKKNGYTPGDFGFDPLGFYPKDEKGKKRMQLSEIKHGRLAMIAITAFAAQEFVAEIAVIDQTPFFFKPITEVLLGQVPGYYIPEDVVTTSSAAVESALDAAASSTAPDALSATTAVEALPQAPLAGVDASVATTTQEATAAAISEEATTTAAAATSSAPPSGTSVLSSDGELEAAQKRIAELEARLTEVEKLVR